MQLAELGAVDEGDEENGEGVNLLDMLQSQMGKPFVRGIIDMLAVEEDTQDVAFDQSNAFFWDGLLQIMGMDLWELLEVLSFVSSFRCLFVAVSVAQVLAPHARSPCWRTS